MIKNLIYICLGFVLGVVVLTWFGPWYTFRFNQSRAGDIGGLSESVGVADMPCWVGTVLGGEISTPLMIKLHNENWKLYNKYVDATIENNKLKENKE